ncbi:MAG: VacJ family lipoprotein [Gammaproteobacteria bacterium]|nr:VacJ family lipoprotein [Gammaproteobacteria bacterium]
MQKFRILIYFSLLTVISGCGSTGGISEGDPFEGFNRGAFKFNQTMDKHLFNPIAETYDKVLPRVVNDGVSNFFSNINDISVIANDILQFKLAQAFSDIGRFILNSTLGLGGFFDVSTDAGLPKHREDFGQTLGKWGFNSGPFLVMPFLGPTTVRAGIGLGVDTIAFNPFTYYVNDRPIRGGLMALELIDFKAKLLSTGELLGIAAVDEYGFLKSVFLQYRDHVTHDRDDDDLVEEDPDFDSFDD